MIQVYTPNKVQLGNLFAYSELSKETGISETATLRFRVPLESSHLFKPEGLVQYKRGKEWIIKEFLQDHEWFEVICKEYHPGLDAWIENQAWITQTAKLMLTELLDGTGVALDMPDYTEKRTVTGSNLSKKELMFKVIDAFGLESTITDSNTLVVRKTLGEDRGAYATDELNLQSLVTAGDTYDFATRIEPRGRDGMTIAEVNGGLTYLDDNSYSDRVIPVYWEDNRYTDKMSLKADALKKLEVLAKPLISYKALILDLARGDESSLFFYALGDSMTLLSSKTNERIQQRIVAIKEYPEEPWRNVATLANRPRTLVNQEVEDLKANYEWVKTSIEQLDDALKLKVSSEEYQLDKESNESRFTAMSSEITQNREGLTSKVDQSDYDSETGRINQQLTEMEQRADALEIAVQDGGGLNQLLNSAGYAELSFWTKTGTVEPSASTWILSESTAKHGFYLSGGSLTQEILLKSEQVYTLSMLVNNLIGSDLKVFLGEKQEDGTVSFAEVYSTGETYKGKVVHEFVANNNTVLKIENSGSASAEVTDIMLAEGKNQTVWTQANGEMYTMNVLIDKNGITVKHTDNSRTVMTPQEFAGYFNEERIFSLNGYLTEVMGIIIKKEGLHIPPIKMVQRPGVSLDIVWTGG